MTAAEIDFIEFHDGQIERIVQRDNGLVLVFEHLYVCLRSAVDHAGWSYRATLELAGASNVTREGDLDPFQPRAAENRPPWVSDGAVLDERGDEIQPVALLGGSSARRFWMFLYNDTEAVKLSADVARATIVLGDALRRLDDCSVVTMTPR